MYFLFYHSFVTVLCTQKWSGSYEFSNHQVLALIKVSIFIQAFLRLLSVHGCFLAGSQ